MQRLNRVMDWSGRWMVRGLVLIMVTQFCDYSKNNWIVQFKLGNYVVNEYLTQ